MTESADTPEAAALILERVELAFPELLTDFRVEERSLCFDGVVVADLLARAGGRTLLISVVEEGEDAACLRALDSLSFARTQVELLADYLPGETLRGTSPEVVLVAESFSARLQARLAVLSGAGDFWLVVRHDLSTARGSLTRLQRLGTEFPSEHPRIDWVELPAWAAEEPLRAFLTRVAPERLNLALEVIERLQRIDSALAWDSAGEFGLTCHLHGAALCQLAWIDGQFELQLEEGGVPHTIRDTAAIDFVLDWVLTCFLDLVEVEVEVEVEPGESSPPREVQAAPPARTEETASDSELRQFELHPTAPAPLLTPEEIQAFQE